jgi:hypothetical protein
VVLIIMSSWFLILFRTHIANKNKSSTIIIKLHQYCFQIQLKLFLKLTEKVFYSQ